MLRKNSVRTTSALDYWDQLVTLHYGERVGITAHFREATMAETGMLWAGAPFATPTDVMLDNSVLRVVIDDASRAFLYQKIKATNIFDKLASVALASSHVGDYVGLRLDDGTDNNYLELVLRCSQANPTLWAVRTVRRTGGGAVTTQDGDDMHTDPGNVLRMEMTGTPWDDGWNIYPALHTNMGFDGKMWKPPVALGGINLVFTPTRAGIVFNPPGEGALIALVDWLDKGRPWRWWDPAKENLCVWAAYDPLRAFSLANSYVDVSGNENDCTPTGVAADIPTWANGTGWTFDGVSQYLTTAFVPQNDQTQTIIVQYDTLTNTGYLCGQREGAAQSFALLPDNGAAAVLYRNGGGVLAAPALAAGNLCVAGNQGYRDGLADGGAIAVWGGAAAQPVYIGALNNLGVVASWVAANIKKVAIYDCTLTAAQVQRIAYAMASS